MKFASGSIATLLVYVALMAVGFAALRSSSRLWATVAFSFALILLLASIALMIYDRGPRRSAWVGFALFGWPYFILAFVPAFQPCRDLLVTAPLLSIVEEALFDSAGQASLGPGLGGAGSPRPGGRITARVELTPWTYWTASDRANPFASDSFQRIGHALSCVGVAIAGALSCRLLRRFLGDASPPP